MYFHAARSRLRMRDVSWLELDRVLADKCVFLIYEKNKKNIKSKTISLVTLQEYSRSGYNKPVNSHKNGQNLLRTWGFLNQTRYLIHHGILAVQTTLQNLLYLDWGVCVLIEMYMYLDQGTYLDRRIIPDREYSRTDIRMSAVKFLPWLSLTLTLTAPLTIRRKKMMAS